MQTRNIGLNKMLGLSLSYFETAGQCQVWPATVVSRQADRPVTRRAAQTLQPRQNAILLNQTDCTGISQIIQKTKKNIQGTRMIKK